MADAITREYPRERCASVFFFFQEFRGGGGIFLVWCFRLLFLFPFLLLLLFLLSFLSPSSFLFFFLSLVLVLLRLQRPATVFTGHGTHEPSVGFGSTLIRVGEIQEAQRLCWLTQLVGSFGWLWQQWGPRVLEHVEFLQTAARGTAGSMSHNVGHRHGGTHIVDTKCGNS